jgi:AraC-like DNA-binding protein
MSRLDNVLSIEKSFFLARERSILIEPGTLSHSTQTQFPARLKMRICSKCQALVSEIGCATCGLKDACRFYSAVTEVLRSRSTKQWHQAIGQACHYRVKELARLLGVSLRELEREFKRQLGRPPQQWLFENRLLEIQRLLLSGLGVKEISAKLSFKHASHLCIQFKRRYQMTPKQFVRSSLITKSFLSLGYHSVRFSANKASENESPPSSLVILHE